MSQFGGRSQHVGTAAGGRDAPTGPSGRRREEGRRRSLSATAGRPRVRFGGPREQPVPHAAGPRRARKTRTGSGAQSNGA